MSDFKIPTLNPYCSFSGDGPVLSVDVLHLIQFLVGFMLRLNTQNNNPKSGCDQSKFFQEIAGPISEIPDGKPIQAAFLALLWQYILNPDGNCK